MTEIFTKNATYQKFEVLKLKRNKRQRYQEFIVEGVRNINEAVNCGWRINSFIYPQKRELSRWATALLRDVATVENFALATHLMDELSSKAQPSELLALVSMVAPPAPPLSNLPLLALFDRPSNKGNLGTLLRSCDALAVERLLITGRSVDIYDPEVLNASTGSFFKQPITQLSDNKALDTYMLNLRQQFPGIQIIGTDETAPQLIYETNLRGPVLLMFGNEKSGLSHNLHQLCDAVAKIPMSANKSASSINISCAATVVLYEAFRQRVKLSSS